MNGDAARDFMMHGVTKLLPQGAGVLRADAGDEHVLFEFDEFSGDLHDLHRSFARAVNDFWKALAQRALRVHLREAEVGERRGLKGAEHLLAARVACAELFQ